MCNCSMRSLQTRKRSPDYWNTKSSSTNLTSCPLVEGALGLQDGGQAGMSSPTGKNREKACRLGKFTIPASSRILYNAVLV